MEDRLKQQKYMLISNTIRVLGFIVLAMFFGKWWIVLFSALFLTYIDDDKEKKESKEQEQEV